MRRAAARTRSSSTPEIAAVLGDRHLPQGRRRPSSSPDVRAARNSRSSSDSSTSTAARAASSQASRPGRTWRWKSASSAVSVRRGSMTTIERAGSLAIALSVVRACGMPWLSHGFLPTNRATSQCSNSPRTGVPSIRPLTQRLARLLLGDGAGAEAGAEGVERGAGVRAAEVVALPAAAVVDDRLAAVGVTDLAEPGGDLADRRVPVDLLERAVGAPPQRVQDPLAAAVLVVVEPQRLLARVALRRRMGLVATDPLERAARRRRGGSPRRSCTRRGCRRSASSPSRSSSSGLLVEIQELTVANLNQLVRREISADDREAGRLAEHQAGRRRRVGAPGAGRAAGAAACPRRRGPPAGPGPCRCRRAARRRTPGAGGRSGGGGRSGRARGTRPDRGWRRRARRRPARPPPMAVPASSTSRVV